MLSLQNLFAFLATSKVCRIFTKQTERQRFMARKLLLPGKSLKHIVMLLPFQGATALTWGDPGCRFACPVLSAPLAFIDIIGCGSAIQASLIAFALHDDSGRPCKNHSGHFYARG